MAGVYAGKLLLVDLSSGKLEEKELSEDFMKKFIGGYGIGAKLLYDMIEPDADPLGPGNVIGFMPGLLNGTGALFGGRYTVVCKSPVTNGWNDANSGGFFGPELKRAGFDGVIVSGASDKPVYIYVEDGKAEIRDASKLWGKNSVETLEGLIEETGEKKLRAAVIGQAGEMLSLMACVINDTHRAAGRGGCGAVMGSKKLKAVAVRGTGKFTVAKPDDFKAITKEIPGAMKEGPMAGMIEGFSNFGTGGGTGGMIMSGDSPIKNWGGAGETDMGKEEADKLATLSYDSKYNTGKYACSNCPMGCGAHYSVKDGKWPVEDTDRPEYETIGAFGAMMLNSNAESVIKCNDICNKYGLDTISVGATIAWAMECFENGIITRDDTGGAELTWGNADAIVDMTQAIADQEGFGKVLALGSEAAAKQLGKGAEYLQNARGIELPMHDPRFAPGFARTYRYDPTPGRHVKGSTGMMEMNAPPDVKYNTENRGSRDAQATYETELQNCAGLCAFSGFAMPPGTMPRYIAAATGWDFSEKDVSETGKRIFNLRHAFNLKAGQDPAEDILTKRATGEPPLTEGPLKGVTINIKDLIDQFCEAVDWDRSTLRPTRESLESLGGLENVVEDLFGD
ncbi:aldehyde ferredoxin oxidoreductase family protein [Thermodesulfobacteriota bacterium]